MDQIRWRPFLLSGLIFLFGLQIIRVFFPSVMWYLSQELGEIQLALYALITFGLIFLAPLLGPVLSQKTLLGFVMGGIIFVRLLLQFNSDAFVGLALSTLGLALFTMFLPIWLQSDHNRSDPSGIPVAAVIFPIVFLMDTVSRTILWSYDLVWRKSWWAFLFILILVALSVWLLFVEMRSSHLKRRFREPSLKRIIPLLGFGAWLYLGQGTLLNPQALMGLTGFGDRIAHLAIVAVSAVGTVLAVWSILGEHPKQGWVFGQMAAAATAAVMLYFKVAPSGIWFLLLSLSLWAGLGHIFRSSAMDETYYPGLWRTALVLFVSFLFMLIFVFLNEFNYDWITPAAVALLAISNGFAAFLSHAGHPLQGIMQRKRIIQITSSAARIAIAAAVLWLLGNQPMNIASESPAVESIRVMTYNIHQGLNAEIYLDLEEITRVIEAQNADIIGLNEVNRARANNGYTDTLALISRRLQMPYIYGANIPDGQYGNAVLSRYPIEEWENLLYNTNTTEVRGMLRAVVSVGDGREITFFSTHLDHISGAHNARAAQIIEARNSIGTEMTIFTGDLNAPPEADELQPLYEYGLVDALAVSGLDEPFTFWSDKRQRIDYIFTTPDLQIGTTAVIEARASDHLPVVSEIYLP